jgi:hypothetical protein
MTWTYTVTGAALLGTLLGSLIDQAVSQSATQGTATYAYVDRLRRQSVRRAVMEFMFIAPTPRQGLGRTFNTLAISPTRPFSR